LTKRRWRGRWRLIAGVALDVRVTTKVEPELLTPENVLRTASRQRTVETRTAMADLAVRNVAAVLSGQPPLTPVP
jgi:lactate dehydrogenase-like 2-hydroxyacid dehydrogenase